MTAPCIDHAQLAVGDRLPSRVRFPTPKQLVQYAGAARDWSAIHYDVDYARQRGFPGVVVHGLLKAAFLAELVKEWAGPDAWVKRFETTYRGVDLPGDPLICRGAVTSVRSDGAETSVEVRLWTEKRTGEVTTEGAATVVVTTGSAR